MFRTSSLSVDEILHDQNRAWARLHGLLPKEAAPRTEEDARVMLARADEQARYLTRRRGLASVGKNDTVYLR